MFGSFPLFSDFKLGRFAGGGIRRAVATFPRLCKPCLGITEDRIASTDFPLYLSNRLRVEYLLFPSLPLVICPKRSDIAMKCHLVRKFFSAPPDLPVAKTGVGLPVSLGPFLWSPINSRNPCWAQQYSSKPFWCFHAEEWSSRYQNIRQGQITGWEGHAGPSRRRIGEIDQGNRKKEPEN